MTASWRDMSSAATFALLVSVTPAASMQPGRDALARVANEMNVLVVTIDTLRPDRLGSYGHEVARTPVLDAIAASGVRFENAYALQPVTLPSHATILTGTHPAHHGVEDNGLFVLPDEAVTVAEALKERGFATGAVIAAFVLHSQYGLDQGFDSYEDSLSAGLKQDAVGFEEMTATGVSDYALEWLEQTVSKRWFLWLHYYDPHGEFEPPPEHIVEEGDLYDGEIAYVDHELGRVMAALRERGLIERTLVLVTSDHGESLGEHGELAHGLFLYDATMRVPLLVSLPGAIPAGRVVPQTVSLMDVAPTILSALGTTPWEPSQGRSFVPLLYTDPEDWEPAPVLMETMTPWRSYGWSPSRAIVADNYKLIEAPTPELYDLESDPAEIENIIDANRPRARAMARRLREIGDRYGRASLESDSRVEMDDEARDRLEALGYVSSRSGSDEGIDDAPDVKDMIELTESIKLASVLRAEGREAEAFTLLERVLEKSPNTRLVLNRLGTWYALKKDFANGEKYLKRLIELDPDYVEAYYNLGLLYVNAARLEDATTMAETVLAKLPRSAKAYGLLGIVRFKERDYRKAVDALDTAIELYPGYHVALYNRSVCYFFLRRFDDALADAKAAQRIAPDNATYTKLIDQLETMKSAR